MDGTSVYSILLLLGFFPVFHCALNDNDLESCMLAKNYEVATKTHEIFRY